MTPEPYRAKMDKYMREVGTLIKKARGKNISQEKLGTAVGLTRTSINNIEHGRQRIMLDTLLLISDILKVEITELLPKNMDITTTLDEKIPLNTSSSVKSWILEDVMEKK